MYLFAGSARHVELYPPTPLLFLSALNLYLPYHGPYDLDSTGGAVLVEALNLYPPYPSPNMNMKLYLSIVPKSINYESWS